MNHNDKNERENVDQLFEDLFGVRPRSDWHSNEIKFSANDRKVNFWESMGELLIEILEHHLNTASELQILEWLAINDSNSLKTSLKNSQSLTVQKLFEEIPKLDEKTFLGIVLAAIKILRERANCVQNEDWPELILENDE